MDQKTKIDYKNYKYLNICKYIQLSNGKIFFAKIIHYLDNCYYYFRQANTKIIFKTNTMNDY